MKTLTVKAQDIKTRDPLMVRIICGVTKGGAHKDRRKEENKKRCRTVIYNDE